MTVHRWLILTVLFVIIEILPPVTQFFFLALAIGAFSAALAAQSSSVVWVPWLVFVAISALLAPQLIQYAKLLFNVTHHVGDPNFMIGQRVVVTETIAPQTVGMVIIAGDSWRALSNGTDTLSKDQWVYILRVEGTHVVVSAYPK